MKKISLIDNFSPRTYQQSIFANCMDKNSLVILPTGLGKTVIAIMLSVYYYNSSGKKILFLAPTKPLVEQQKISFEGFFKNSFDFSFVVLTGLVSPKKRVDLYANSDFIFSTPQLVENDIINGIVNMKDFGLVVFDEAHRASGNYSYCFIAENLKDVSGKILALTASPGSNKEEIYSVIKNLNIENIEVKKAEDKDVKPYINNVVMETVKVSLTPEFIPIREKLQRVYDKRLKFLKDEGFLIGKNLNQVSKKDLLDLQTYLRQKISVGEADDLVWKAISISAGLMKLQYGMELFESQQVISAYNYFYNFFREGGDSSKAVSEILTDADFRSAYEDIIKLNKLGIVHPKLLKLKDLVIDNLVINPDLKIIIFNQYRDSANLIVQELSSLKEIKAALFIGQNKKGDIGLSQKEQKKILSDFREGLFNVLVSTSVGEEGLDIPKVDLVIFYEPVPSAIRSIQRIGRTGRFKEGKGYVMVTEGTRDVITKFVATAKERRMYRVLDEIKKEIFSDIGDGSANVVKNNVSGLSKYISNSSNIDVNDDNANNFNLSKQENDFVGDDKIRIYVDTRENSDLIKEFFRMDEIEVISKKLEIGDIVISQDIAIERKAKIDFVNSILDKRIFPQVISLAKNFKKPMLILEGSEDIYTLRNVHQNVIRSALCAIAIDLRIPILFTSSMKETALTVLTICKRVLKKKKDISLVTDKGGHSENEEMEKFVSSIPKINVVSAKLILINFKTIKKFVNSSEKELLNCEGIGKLRAKYLKEFFEREYK